MIDKTTILDNMKANTERQVLSDGWANQFISTSVEDLSGLPSQPIPHAIEYRFEFKWTILTRLSSLASNDEFIAMKERAANSIIYEMYKPTADRMIQLAYKIRSGSIGQDEAYNTLMKISRDLIE